MQEDMVRTRLKAALDGWKLYRIGADLDRMIGQTDPREYEPAIRRMVQSALTRQFLPAGSFTVKTVALGNMVYIYVYLQERLLASYTVNLQCPFKVPFRSNTPGLHLAGTNNTSRAGGRDRPALRPASGDQPCALARDQTPGGSPI
jgi:hypothetical protein